MKYILTIYLCTAVLTISSAFYCRHHSLLRMVPRMGVEANYFRGGTRVLRVLAVFREYMLQALEISTGSTLLTPGALQPFRMFVLLALGVLYYSSYSQYWQYLGLQYSSCSYSQYAQYLGHHVREYNNTLSTSSTQSIEPRNTTSTGSIGKKVSNTIYACEHTVPPSSIMHRHTYLQ